MSTSETFKILFERARRVGVITICEEQNAHSPNKKMNVAGVTIPGGVRHPQIGWHRNRECEMIAALEYGSGKLLVRNADGSQAEADLRNLNDGLLRVPAGTAYAWLATGDDVLGFSLISSPPWTSDQYEILDESGDPVTP